MDRQLPGSAVHHHLCVDGRSSWRHCLEGGQLQTSLIFERKNLRKRRTTHSSIFLGILLNFRVIFWRSALFEILSIFVQKCIFFSKILHIFSAKNNTVLLRDLCHFELLISIIFFWSQIELLISKYFRLQPTCFLQNRTFISCIIHSFC